MAQYTNRFVALAVVGGITGTAACAAGGLYLLAKATEQWEPVPPIVAPAASPGDFPCG